MKTVLSLLVLGLSSIAMASETTVPVSAQTGMNVTIYNENRALIKDKRQVDLTAGINELAFRGVSANMMPQTALLKGDGISTREQNFNFDLLTRNALLQKSVGRQVTVEYIDPATGKTHQEKAEILAFNDGHPVLKIGNKIETDYPGRVIFDSVPENLRAQPTLAITLVSKKAGADSLELDYLTTGLSWKADYVAKLNADETKMNLNGFVTLTNNSGADYKQALLQLVAGDVNVVSEYMERPRMLLAKSANALDMVADGMEAEALTDFYIYTVPHKTDLLSNQTKQVALLSVADVGVKKTYELNRPFSVHQTERKNMKPDIYVSFLNTPQNGLGKPLPKGTIRMYKEDSKENMQFIGEDRIQHIADGENVRLRLGTSFNLTADMKRTALNKISEKTQIASYEVVFKNGSDENAEIELTLGFPDDFKLLDQSQKGERVTSNTIMWAVSVPAKGEARLTYKVQY